MFSIACFMVKTWNRNFKKFVIGYLTIQLINNIVISLKKMPCLPPINVSMQVSRAYKYKTASVILSVLFKIVHSCTHLS